MFATSLFFCLIPALFVAYFLQNATLQLILLIPALFPPYSCLIPALFLAYFLQNATLQLILLIPALFLAYFLQNATLQLILLIPALFPPYSCLISGLFFAKCNSATNSAYSRLISGLFFAKCNPATNSAYSCLISGLFFAKCNSATNSAYSCLIFCEILFCNKIICAAFKFMLWFWFEITTETSQGSMMTKLLIAHIWCFFCRAIVFWCWDSISGWTSLFQAYFSPILVTLLFSRISHE